MGNSSCPDAKPANARLLAEKSIGIENLFALDRIGLGVFSRGSERTRISHFQVIEQENRKLHAIIADALSSLPFGQRLRLIYRALGIPCVMPGCAHEDVIRRRLRRRIRPKRIRIHG